MNQTSINELFDLEDEKYEEYDNYDAIKYNNNVNKTAQYIQKERYNYDNYPANNNENNNTNNNANNYPANNISVYTQENSDEIANYIAESYKLAEYLKKHDKEAYKIASRFYYSDNTFLIIAVIILSITTLLLIKRLVKL